MRWPVSIAVFWLLVAACPPALAETRYVTPTGNDGGSCTESAPCRSWVVAYQRAVAGDEVLLGGGDYGDVVLRGLARKASPERVVFRPAPGARVTVGDLDIDGTNDIEIQQVTSNEGWSVHGMAENVVLRDVRVIGSAYGGFLGGSRGVRVIGGEIGLIDPNDGLHMNVADGDNYDTIIDGLYMHDLTRQRDGSAHTDCMQVGSAIGLTVRNSRFVNCATQGLFVSQYGGGTTRDVTIENNWLGRAQLGYYALYVGAAKNVVVRNNSIAGSGAYVDTRDSDTTMVANILSATDAFGCATLASRTVAFAYNVTSAGCSGASRHLTDPRVLDGFVNASPADSGGLDLHLRANAAAIDRGDPTNAVARDFDGDARPQGGGPDAGADEFTIDRPAGSPDGTAEAPALPGTPEARARTVLGRKSIRVTAIDRLAGVQVFAATRPLRLRASSSAQKVLAVVAEHDGTLRVTQRLVFGRRSARLQTRSLRLRAGSGQAIVVRLTRSARQRLRRAGTARLALGLSFTASGRRTTDRTSLRVRRR